ncbi:MAG: DUF2188 domain-containing protein [Pseudomonadota bacterium]
MENYHVKKHHDHWDLTREGAAQAAISKPTKAEIISAMETFVKDKKVSVKIHGEDGRFQEERTYPRSSDPKRSPG